MVRIGISVEGPTEERFVKMVLTPYLAAKQIYITPISMGGGVSVDRARNELKSMANCFDYVTTFYDVYGFGRKNDGESKESLEQRIYDTAHDGVKPKLIPYVQLHEFEGLLFSDPEALSSVLLDEELTEWAANILAEFDNNPELINNSVETAPSKRLEKDTPYRKTTHGPNIAKAIGVEKMREMCAGFNEWLGKLEGLAA